MGCAFAHQGRTKGVTTETETAHILGPKNGPTFGTRKRSQKRDHVAQATRARQPLDAIKTYTIFTWSYFGDRFLVPKMGPFSGPKSRTVFLTNYQQILYK